MLIVKMQFGSHVYGTNLPTSDLDYKAIHLPEINDILLQRVKDTIVTSTKKDSTSRNTTDDIDFESFSLQKYMHLLLQGQAVPLSMMFTPQKWIREETELWQKIKDTKHLWLHRGVSAFAGYCRQQANKYGIKGSRIATTRIAVKLFEDLAEKHGHLSKLSEHWNAIVDTMQDKEHVEFIVEGIRGNELLPVRMMSVCNRKVQEHITVKEAHRIYRHVFDEYGKRALEAETNDNVDWKAMMHATRVAKEAEELLMHHKITYPRPEADLLLKIRKGEMPYKEVADILEAGLIRLNECQAISKLPEKPDYMESDNLVAAAYLDVINASIIN